jgi:uncharacterized membrane protein YhaH (DUF805 family)
MSDVFISYAQGDRDWVKEFAASVEEEGFSVWWDPDIVAGARYREIIDAELEKAAAVVVVWSNLSIHSDYVRDEADEALAAGKLVPVLRSAVRPPKGFRQVQTIDLSQWRGRRESPEFRKVVSGIRALVGTPTDTVADSDAVPVRPLPPPPRAVPKSVTGWHRWLTWHGRDTRLPYALQMLVALVSMIAIVAAAIELALAMRSPDDVGVNAAVPLFLILGVGAWIAFVVLAHIRRLHDLNVSGWWIVAIIILTLSLIFMIAQWVISSRDVWLVPLFLSVLVTPLVLSVVPGTHGDNRYGPDPRSPRG